METRLKGSETEIVIGPDRPTVIIGERINPSGRRRLREALERQDMSVVREEALAQVRAGADIIDVNVSAPGLDERKLLPLAVQAVAEVVPVPICIDTADPEALAVALEACPGKPLVNSVNGEERSLREILPLARQRGAAVIGLAMGEQGVLTGVEERVEMARLVLRACISAGIPREDVILDPLALAVAADPGAALATLTTIHRLAQIEEVNMTLGASNISFGMPEREAMNEIFVALAIAAGVTCPILDPVEGRRAVLIADLILGRDDFAKRYLAFVRQMMSGSAR
jgi:5-methyltetrahydrofolate--homocysteine methyltransferase